MTEANDETLVHLTQSQSLEIPLCLFYTYIMHLNLSGGDPKNHSKQKHLKYNNQLQVNPYC